MNALPVDLLHKYSMLPTDEIMDGIELAIIRVMEQTHRTPASAIFEPETGMVWVTLLGSDQFSTVDLTRTKRKTKRRLLDEIERELMRRQTIAEANYYHTLTRTAVTGTVRTRRGNDLEIDLEVMDGLKQINLTALCPPAHQTAKDYHRGAYASGRPLTFYALSARPVENSRQSWVRVIVSRKARELPSRMLESLTGLSGIRCIKRNAGNKSIIITRHPLPKSAVNTVGKELMETIEVTCPGGGKPYFRS